jgi:hypothetical protein
MSSPGANTASRTVYVTLTGLPLLIRLDWPFHHSSSGADFWVLHGDIRLANVPELRALVAVNLSATLREVVPSLEPKDIEAPAINAIRKEVDRQQLEFVKSAKLVPVHFSSRHFNFKQNRWVFGHATDETIAQFLERKIYWQSKIVGGDVWIGDAVEAQYLETTADHLTEIAAGMAKRGLITLERRHASANAALMAQAELYEGVAAGALRELENKHAFERG